MSKIKLLTQVLKNQGFNYVAYRAWYEIRRKRGWLKRRFPAQPKMKSFIDLKEWRAQNIPFFFESKEKINFPKKRNSELAQRFGKIQEGQVLFFNSEWKNLGPEYDWITNPDTNHRYDINTHWSQVEDFSAEAGDIKYVWEKSRFSYLYDIIRHDYHFEEDHAELVFSEIESWMDANPINQGPNYKCSQEISLRCMNWIFALHYYKNHVALSESRFQRIVHFLYWQIKHVWENINFSRICVRNNHAITETLMLFIGGLLFPFFPESNKWRTNGKKWLENEVEYQVYSDGTYLQFSHNYQRVLVQLLTWGIALSEIHGDRLADYVYVKAESVLKYLRRNCIGRNGELPNYGNNDGALFFRLNNQAFSDFRPSLNALHYILTKQYCFKDPALQEDGMWYGDLFEGKKERAIDFSDQEIRIFSDGGIATIVDNSFTFLKCTKYKDRPWQADNMHLDIWVDGINYLRDSGTYKYNTEEELINYFAGTYGHNSLLIGKHNQMQKGPRFIWYDWTNTAELKSTQTNGKLVLNAEAHMFQTVDSSVKHMRSVYKTPKSHVWEIHDEIKSKPEEHLIRQCWHPHPKQKHQIVMNASDEFGNPLEMKKTKGWFSDHYGKKEEVPLWVFESNGNKIITKIEIRN